MYVLLQDGNVRLRAPEEIIASVEDVANLNYWDTTEKFSALPLIA